MEVGVHRLPLRPVRGSEASVGTAIQAEKGHLDRRSRLAAQEQLRTFAINSRGAFVPMRRLSRGGDCVRWIAGASPSELGGGLQWAILAVVSRDGRRLIASGRGGKGTNFSATTNTLFTCLHTDSSIDVPARGQATTRQVFWFLEGGLEDLSKRWRRDLGSGK